MLSQRLRERLAELNRQPLPTAAAATRPDTARTNTAHSKPASPARDDSVSSDDDAYAKGREVETPYGKHLLIERLIGALWPKSQDSLARTADSLSTVATDEAAHPDWQRFAAGFPREAVFLDLETCGFAGSMVFLVGVIHEDENGLVLSQLLARNYAEEAAMFFTLWEIMRSRGLLLTFNGKSFDWPMVNDRSVLYRLDTAGYTRDLDHHIDLLHHARRQFRRELPNCRLQTLEWYLCGRRRTGDIPGSEIPDAYHDYVRTGDTWEMKSILHHNALDLITLLQLSLRMATGS